MGGIATHLPVATGAELRTSADPIAADAIASRQRAYALGLLLAI